MMTINLITCRKTLLKGVAKCQIPNFNFFRYFASNFIIFFVIIAFFFFWLDVHLYELFSNGQYNFNIMPKRGQVLKYFKGTHNFHFSILF